MGRLSSLPSALVTDDSALGGLTIEKSLRFDGNTSSKLTRTPSSAGNRRTFTFSFWIKRGRSEDSRYIFGGRLAEYKYYDMDQVIGSALTKFKRVNKL